MFRLWPGAMGWTDPLLMVAGCAILLRFGLWLDRQREAVPVAAPLSALPGAGRSA